MKQGRSPLLVAFVTVAIDLLGFGIVLPLLPRYGERFLPPDAGELARGATLGLLMASFSLMQFLFAPVWGMLSDRIGRRPVLMVGLAGSTLSYVLFGVATILESLVLLFVGRIGAGIAGATIGTAQAVIADSTPPEKRAKGMALIGMAFGVGFTVGPVLGSFWVSDVEGRVSAAPGFIAAGLSFLALLLAAFRLPEKTLRQGNPAGRGWFELRGLKLALGNPAVAIPLVTFFVATFAFAILEGTMARFTWNILGFSDRDNFYLFAFIGLVLALTQGLFVRRVVTRVGEVAMVIGGIALMMLGLGAMAAAATAQSDHGFGSLILILAAVAVSVMGFACLTPSAQALISRRSSVLHQGEVLGVAQSASAIARILGPFLGNVLYDLQRTHGLPYVVGAGLLGLALLLGLRLKRNDQGPMTKAQRMTDSQ